MNRGRALPYSMGLLTGAALLSEIVIPVSVLDIRYQPYDDIIKSLDCAGLRRGGRS
ncbi:MAG: hypothetical protein ACI87W_002239 [Halieaceae bacterium]|jgi:hypothetical protein